jgi:osmoprotectant transport system substrate-binding protein
MTGTTSTRVLIAVCTALALLTTACGNGNGDLEEGSIAQSYDLSGAELTVGSKEFTEQLILGHIARIALEAAGADVDDEIGTVGTGATRGALESGRTDMYWEYTGTAWFEFFGEDEVIDEDTQYEQVSERDLEENDIRWLEPAPFDNTFAIAVRQEFQEETGLETLSDLEGYVAENPDEATFCMGTEFSTRPDGFPGLQELYNFEVPDANVNVLDVGPIYNETATGGACNFGEVFATDGRIAALDLHVLEDDQGYFPVYNPSLTVRNEVYEEWSDIEGLFAEIAQALDMETMQRLNADVDVEGFDPDQVAEDWLREQGFIG